MGREIEPLKDPNLTCYGCAHSASGYPFPSFPSGERPCCFCVRSPDVRKTGKPYSLINDQGEEVLINKWYDGSPAIKPIMDNYIALDRLDQEGRFATTRLQSDLGWLRGSIERAEDESR